MISQKLYQLWILFFHDLDIRGSTLSWFRIFSDDHFFSLVNGLNPGRFDTSKEDDETTALTLILSPVSGTNTISNFNQMVTFAELLASKLDLNLFDSERNPLTQQMIDHYSHQAEDFDLRNFA